MEYSLRLAPDLLFNRDEWARFVAQFDTAETALNRISTPPSLPHGFHRESDIGLPTSVEARSRHTELTFALGTKLVSALKTDLVAGVIITSGIPVPYGERKIIPAEEWMRLWPYFAEESAWGQMGAYSQVKLRSNSDKRVLRVRLLENCLKWLRDDTTGDGLTKKEALRSLADEHFHQKIPVRVFNEAYRRAFDRQRGRPTKKE
jgi:hypothetical protein